MSKRYSRLMGTDEEGTLERLKARTATSRSENRLATKPDRQGPPTMDLVGFASVVGAAGDAVHVQQAMPEPSTGIRTDDRIVLRIGINLWRRNRRWR
jgi:hypothetical protein